QVRKIRSATLPKRNHGAVPPRGRQSAGWLLADVGSVSGHHQRVLRGVAAQGAVSKRALALGWRSVHASREAAAVASLSDGAQPGVARHDLAAALRDLDVLLLALRDDAVGRSAAGA